MPINIATIDPDVPFAVQKALDTFMTNNIHFFQINVPPGIYPDAFTIGAGLACIIIGPVRSAHLGDCQIDINDVSSFRLFRTVGIGNIKIMDNVPNENANVIQAMAFEDVSMYSLIQDGYNHDIDVSIAGSSVADGVFARSLGASCAVYGPIKITGNLLGRGCAFLGGHTLEAKNFTIHASVVEHNLKAKGTEISMLQCKWIKPNLFVKFVNKPGVLSMDTTTNYYFKKNNIKLINGTIEVIA